MAAGTAQGEALREALQALHTRLFEAYERGNAGAVAALCTADAALVEPEREPIVGRAAIEAHLGAWMERFRFFHVQGDIREVEGFGDAAYDLSYCSMQARERATGRARTERWKQVTLWKREADGWRLHRLIYNSHRP